MPQGISIHIGVDRVKPGVFDAAQLTGCENDARAMHEIARQQGFGGPEPFINDTAIFERIRPEILSAAADLNAGDIFLFTFAGHGSQMEDFDFDEVIGAQVPDDFDETIVIYDRILLDDFLRRGLWSQFRPGVRLFLISDSCHSGSFFAGPSAAEAALAGVDRDEKINTRQPLPSPSPVPEGETEVVSTGSPLVRKITDSAKRNHLRAFRAFYDEMIRNLPTGAAAEIKASVLALAACQDHEDAVEEGGQGVFTRALLNVWNGGNFDGDYKAFHSAIASRLAGRPQNPALIPLGQPDFSGERPFSI